MWIRLRSIIRNTRKTANNFLSLSGIMEEKIMGKEKIFIGILTFSVFAATACNKGGATSDKISDNNLNATIGGGGDHNIVLDADGIKSEKVATDYTYAIQNLVEGKKGYEKEHDELIQEVKNVIDGNKAYISLQPLFQWDANENVVITLSPALVVFSENYDKAWRIGLMWENGKYVYHGSRELETNIYDALKDEKKEYIYLGAYEQEELISEQNKLIQIAGMNSNTVTVKGDYFKRIADSDIAISMKKFKENVVEIDK